MAADTTCRCVLLAKAGALRMKCTRHRCQVALSTFEAAALMPSWLSLMTGHALLALRDLYYVRLLVRALLFSV